MDNFAACSLTIRQRQEKGCRLTTKCQGCPNYALVEERMGKSRSFVDQKGNEVPTDQLTDMWK